MPWGIQRLARHDLIQAVQARNAVAQRHHRADFIDRDPGLVMLNLFPNKFRNLVCSNLRHVRKKIPYSYSAINCALMRRSCPRREPS